MTPRALAPALVLMAASTWCSCAPATVPLGACDAGLEPHDTHQDRDNGAEGPALAHDAGGRVADALYAADGHSTTDVADAAVHAADADQVAPPIDAAGADRAAPPTDGPPGPTLCANPGDLLCEGRVVSECIDMPGVGRIAVPRLTCGGGYVACNPTSARDRPADTDASHACGGPCGGRCLVLHAPGTAVPGLPCAVYACEGLCTTSPSRCECRSTSAPCERACQCSSGRCEHQYCVPNNP